MLGRLQAILPGVALVVVVILMTLVTLGLEVSSAAMQSYPWWVETELDSRGATFTFGAPCNHRGYRVAFDVTTGCESGQTWVWEEVLDFTEDTGFGYTTIFVPWSDLPVSRIPDCGECIRVWYDCSPSSDYIKCGYDEKVVKCLVYEPIVGKSGPMPTKTIPPVGTPTATPPFTTSTPPISLTPTPMITPRSSPTPGGG